MVTLLYFAWVREKVGLDREELELPPGIDTPALLVGWLTARSAGHAEAFSNCERLRCAVNQTMVAMDAPLGDAREIAIFPPVTGG